MVGGRSTHRGWLQEGVVRGSMLGKSILPTDEELGKKDDDHKPGSFGRIPTWRPASRVSLRWRKRRILLAILGLCAVCLLYTTMPTLADLREKARPYSIITMTDGGHTGVNNEEPTGAPPGLKASKDGSPRPREYDGQLRFYRLATSLHGASHTQGYRTANRNVMFAMSSLKSVSIMLPMICEMARWKRNWVHAVFMGREDIPIADLLEINGIDQTSCLAIWHDARPDYMEYSSDIRAESSVSAAMTHIHSFLHPQVAIMDDSNVEDATFVTGLRAKTNALGMPIIEIPKDHSDSLMWLTRLDAGSLKSWHQPNVDILIQAPAHSSGGLLRLLKSLKQADYSGLKPPRLTIELPADIDPVAKDRLENFAWPPGNDNPLVSNQLSIHRRISSDYATPVKSATRFLELFYPASTANSHVLLLSPQSQLSPLYYHYLKYSLLEYKYSQYGSVDIEKVMGISLELPSLQLDGKSKLPLPKLADMHVVRYNHLFGDISSPQFLWQAPNSHATLYFGSKWAELHSFLSNRIAKQHTEPKAARPKLISESLPAWTEYLLELMRARGYTLLYPSTTGSETLVTIHNELYHPPEEFETRPKNEVDTNTDAPPKLPDEAFLRAEVSAAQPSNLESPVIPISRPLHVALPFDGDLPELSHLPYLLYNGEMIPPANITSFASAYADKFRQVIGRCKIPDGKHRRVVAGSARDLFCFGDEDEEDWEDDIPMIFDAGIADTFAEEKVSEVLQATPTPSVEGGVGVSSTVVASVETRA
jgi:hypothetical protein